MRLFPAKLVPIGLGLVLLLGGTGCATTSDLGKLNRTLTQKLEEVDGTLRTQVEELRAELKTTQATHTELYDQLTKTLEGVKSEMATATMVTEYWAETMRGIKQMAAWADEMNNQLGSVRQLRVAVEQLPSLLRSVGTEVHAIRQTLLNTYKLEEAALRERLKALDHMRRQLETSPERPHSGKFTAQ